MSGHFARMPIHEAPWADGRHDPGDIANYADYFAGLASSVADLLASDDSRTADAFITGAQQALARFNATTRASKKTRRSTFRFAEQKQGNRPGTVFTVADASPIEAQKQLLGGRCPIEDGAEVIESMGFEEDFTQHCQILLLLCIMVVVRIVGFFALRTSLARQLKRG